LISLANDWVDLFTVKIWGFGYGIMIKNCLAFFSNVLGGFSIVPKNQEDK
jgi:hypothetical protein